MAQSTCLCFEQAITTYKHTQHWPKYMFTPKPHRVRVLLKNPPITQKILVRIPSAVQHPAWQRAKDALKPRQQRGNGLILQQRKQPARPRVGELAFVRLRQLGETTRVRNEWATMEHVRFRRCSCLSTLTWNRTRLVASSAKMQPRLHTSIFWSYGSPRMTSGARYERLYMRMVNSKCLARAMPCPRRILAIDCFCTPSATDCLCIALTQVHIVPPSRPIRGQQPWLCVLAASPYPCPTCTYELRWSVTKHDEPRSMTLTWHRL